ncbi:hypothetical protein P378_11565 [Desulforamulus profundi]|uniref:Uncharacterized protein n=1 Tax=Desulforamulus profundi TaxID=1383067 RepID=A0A2C6MFN2_9FIRM|nr:hypothetical protein [Desulforamulus profundi]PHJ38176.1 hypothetical protein P378_11565 [Desulforamulus profundi]
MKKLTAEAIVRLLDKTRQYCPTIYSLLSAVPQTTINEVAGGQQQAAAVEPELEWDDDLELDLELEDYEENTFETVAHQETASALDPVTVLETPYPRVYIAGIDWFGRILLLENLLHLRLPKGQPPANGSFRVYCIYGAENLVLAELDEGWQQIQHTEVPHYLLDEKCTALFFSTTSEDLDPGTLLVFSESLGNLDLNTA